MNDHNETCRILTAFRAELDSLGIPTMRGNRIGDPTTRLYVLSAYSNGVGDAIGSGNRYPVDLRPLTEELHVITASAL